MDAYTGLAMGDGSMWPVYALAALTIMYVVLRPMMRRKKDPLERMPSLSLSQQRSVEREMSNLLVELSQMTRQITAQLDTRSAKLEALIAEADERIAELKRLADRLEAGRAAEIGGKGDGVRDSAGALRGPAEIDPRHEEVYALADAGRSALDIAHELDRPRGEIELILALRQR